MKVPMSILTVAHTVCKPKSLPMLFRGIFEVPDAVATLGKWERNIRFFEASADSFMDSGFRKLPYSIVGIWDSNIGIFL